MSMRDNGGPVYPGPWHNDGDLNATAPNGDVVPPGGTTMLPGITLRDYFAAKAMQAMTVDSWPDEKERIKIAERAYAIADEMLEARK